MKITSIAITLLALTLTVSCKNNNTTTSSNTTDQNTAVASSSSTTTLTPEQLGELGAKIKNNPNDAQKLLSEKGLTQESFEQQIRKVAEDPEASKRYAAAYKKTG